ncbi:MAG: tetratricopeptide repeat protein [Planctomycetia bacterium]|nr:tetratricopeptide repeat protein [Planctomycetia bacterium]
MIPTHFKNTWPWTCLLLFTLMVFSPTAFPQENKVEADMAYRGAMALTTNGEYKLGREAWNDFLEKFPNNSQRSYALYYNGLCLFYLKEYDAAIEKFREAAADPQFENRDELLYLEAMTHYEKARVLPERNFAQILQDVRNAAKTPRTTPESRAIYDEAIRLFRTLISQFPHSARRDEAYYYCAVCFQKIGKYDDAIALLRVLVQKKEAPILNRARLTLAEVLLNSAKPDPQAVVELLDAVLSSQPDVAMEAAANKFKADAFYLLKRYSDAAAVIEKMQGDKRFAEVWNPPKDKTPILNLSQLYYRYGETLIRLERFHDAIDTYRSLLRLGNNTAYGPYAKYQLGYCIRQYRDQHPDAKEPSADECVTLWLEILSDENTRNDTLLRAAAVHALAQHYQAVKQPEKGLELIERIPADKRPARLKRDRASLLAEMERDDEAIAQFQELFRESQTEESVNRTANMMYRVIRLYAKTKRHDKTLAAANELMAWDGFPRVSSSVRMYVQQEKASALLQLKRYAEAEAVFQELIAKYPESKNRKAWVLWCGTAMQNGGNYAGMESLLLPFFLKFDDPVVNVETGHLLGAAYLQQARTAEDESQRNAFLDKAERTLLPVWELFEKTPDLPRGDVLMCDLAETYLREKKYAQSDALLKEAYRQYQESPWLDRILSLRGQCMMEQNKNKAALQAFTLLLDKRPESALVPDALLAAGQCQLRLGNAKEAVEWTSRLRRDYPQDKSNVQAAGVRARAATKLSDYQTAREAWQSLYDASENETKAFRSEAIFGLGFCDIQCGKDAEAEAWFRQLLQETPDWEMADRVRYQLIKSLLNRGMSDVAEKELQEMASKYPDSEYLREAYYHMALVLFQKKQTENARGYFEKVLSDDGMDPLNRMARLKITQSYQMDQMPDKAEAMAEESLKQIVMSSETTDANQKKLRAYQAELQFLLGMSQFKLGKPALSLENLRQSLDGYVLEQAYCENATETIVQIYETNAQWQDVLRWAGHFVKKYPDSEGLPRICYKEAFAMYQLGKLSGAMKLCEQVASMNDPLFVTKSLFLLGEIQFLKKDHEAAIKTFYKIIYGMEEPTYQADAMYETARCFEMLRKPDEAKKHYQQLLERFPESDKASIAKRKLEKLSR